MRIRMYRHSSPFVHTHKSGAVSGNLAVILTHTHIHTHAHTHTHTCPGLVAVSGNLTVILPWHAFLTGQAQ